MSQPAEAHNGKNSAYLALGSNVNSPVGSPLVTLLAALEALSDDSLEVVQTSRFYSTSAFPAGSGPDFVNAAAELRTAMSCDVLLDRLHEAERQLGRVRSNRWAPRTVDLDLIAFGDRVLPDLATFERWRALPLEAQKQETPDALILPHPRLQDRAFVLGPLMDIAPDWTHPVLALTVSEMFQRCSPADRAALKPLETP